MYCRWCWDWPLWPSCRSVCRPRHSLGAAMEATEAVVAAEATGDGTTITMAHVVAAVAAADANSNPAVARAAAVPNSNRAVANSNRLVVASRAAVVVATRAAAAAVRAARPSPLSRTVTQKGAITTIRLLKSLIRSKADCLIFSSCSPSGRCPTYDLGILNRASIRGLSRVFTGRELLQRSPASFLRTSKMQALQAVAANFLIVV
jgi:hypothetical protein